MKLVRLKSREEIEKISKSGKIIAKLFKELEPLIREGIKTIEIDSFAESFILKNNAIPAFKGYNGFKHSLCISVNEEVIHGIPGSRILREGDIVSIDCGVVLSGFYSDSAKTFSVGKIEEKREKLMQVTKTSLEKAIEEVKIGNRLLDISKAVENYVKPFNFGIVRDYTGHGTGFALHEEPSIPNYYSPNFPNLRLKAGMVLAIEPMVNLGIHRVKLLKDKWTVVTEDGSPSAHYEHTVALTSDGPKILTL